MLSKHEHSAPQQVGFWRKNPLVAPAMTLCAGIWLGRYLHLDLTAPLVIAGALILAAITIRALGLGHASIPLLLAIGALGLVRYHASLIHAPDPIAEQSVEGIIRGKICETPQVFQRQNSIRGSPSSGLGLFSVVSVDPCN